MNIAKPFHVLSTSAIKGFKLEVILPLCELQDEIAQKLHEYYLLLRSYNKLENNICVYKNDNIKLRFRKNNFS